jgi:hypothetical protein
MKLHSNSRTRGRLCLRPLAACLAVTLSSGASATGHNAYGEAMVTAIRSNHVAHFAHPSTVTSSVTHLVTTCDDPSPVPSTCAGSTSGTLRKGFLCGQNGDTIDLTQLQCSKITLSAPLVSGQVTLTLVGPGADKLTIDAASQSRAIVHKGGLNDLLYVKNLSIANGRYDNPSDSGYGGCIYSSGNVTLFNSTVSSCYASAPAGLATGGAIFAKGNASLNHATVSGGTASGAAAAGGGIYAGGTVELNRSTVSGSMAKSDGVASAGGIYASAVYVTYSTISGNAADAGGGIFAGHVYVFDSTIAGNHADFGSFGGIYARDTAEIFNSTISGNSNSGDVAGGLFVQNASALSTDVRNTIIANNKAGGVELDVGTGAGVTISGDNNIIMAHQAGTTVPAGTIADDPMLGPLQDNGGETRTLALKPGSPAIDKGGTTQFSFDQRDSPRIVGSKTDIGAFEFDPEHIFANGFNL